MQKLINNVAIVTGAGAGIGRAITLSLVKEGAYVIANDIDEATCKETIEICESIRPKRAGMVIGDVSTQETWNNIRSTIDVKKKIDILVNNAAYLKYAPILHTPEVEWDKHMATSLKSLYWSAQICLPLMIKNRRGVIINIASVHSHLGFRGSCAYDVCKMGMIAFTKSLAIDYAEYGIRVNSISPGFIATQQNELSREDVNWTQNMAQLSLLKRPGLADEVANIAIFLACNEASFITGADFLVDGGLTAFK